MDIFFDILTRVTAPVVALMALGWIAQRWLVLDASSLSRMLVHVVLPCAFVYFLTTADLPLAAVWPTVWFTVLSFTVFLALGWAAAVPFERMRGSAVVIGLAAAFGVGNGLTDVLVVAAAAPVGVLLAIFCAEYDRAPNLATASVLLSTVLSPPIVTAWLLAVRLY